eukprot:Rhum_TRINITY_DN15125_c18_g1::Rhum_TRINITY_DN15125_c18_g1_i1::g.138252::m.138252
MGASSDARFSVTAAAVTAAPSSPAPAPAAAAPSFGGIADTTATNACVTCWSATAKKLDSVLPSSAFGPAFSSRSRSFCSTVASRTAPGAPRAGAAASRQSAAPARSSPSTASCSRAEEEAAEERPSRSSRQERSSRSSPSTSATVATLDSLCMFRRSRASRQRSAVVATMRSRSRRSGSSMTSEAIDAISPRDVTLPHPSSACTAALTKCVSPSTTTPTAMRVKVKTSMSSHRETISSRCSFSARACFMRASVSSRGSCARRRAPSPCMQCCVDTSACARNGCDDGEYVGAKCRFSAHTPPRITIDRIRSRVLRCLKAARSDRKATRGGAIHRRRVLLSGEIGASAEAVEAAAAGTAETAFATVPTGRKLATAPAAPTTAAAASHLRGAAAAFVTAVLPPLPLPLPLPLP